MNQEKIVRTYSKFLTILFVISWVSVVIHIIKIN